MIFHFSFIQYLFYILLIYCSFDITNVSGTTTTSNQPNPTTDSSYSDSEETTTTVPIMNQPSTTAKKDNTTIVTSSKPIVHIKPTVGGSFIQLVNNSSMIINTTRVSQSTTSSLATKLTLIFGGLGIITLIASLIIFMLIKKGYINIFNEPRTRIKNVERNKIIDSLSATGRTSPSRR